jgi:hypothetical protein
MLENIRILKEVNISLIVSDKGAILFLKKDGEIDYRQCLIDNHEGFISWTKKLFEWYWNKGNTLQIFIRKAMRFNQQLCIFPYSFSLIFSSRILL